MYDIVLVNCPTCGREEQFQSKSGDCVLGIYTLETCPKDILEDVNRHSPYTCDCGTLFEVDVSIRKSIKL